LKISEERTSIDLVPSSYLPISMKDNSLPLAVSPFHA